MRATISAVAAPRCRSALTRRIGATTRRSRGPQAKWPGLLAEPPSPGTETSARQAPGQARPAGREAQPVGRSGENRNSVAPLQGQPLRSNNLRVAADRFPVAQHCDEGAPATWIVKSSHWRGAAAFRHDYAPLLGENGADGSDSPGAAGGPGCTAQPAQTLANLVLFRRLVNAGASRLPSEKAPASLMRIILIYQIYNCPGCCAWLLNGSRWRLPASKGRFSSRQSNQELR
jgi:hypothetical protein